MKNRSQSTLEAPNNETPKKGAARGFNDWFGCLILLALLFAGLFLLEMYSGVVSYAFGTAKDTIADTLSAVGVDGIPNHNRTMLDEYSNADHGDGLREVMNAIRKEPVEYLVLFAGSEKMFERTDKSDHQVETNRGMLTYIRGLSDQGLVCLHNHPFEGATFSLADYGFYHQWDVELAIVVTEECNFWMWAPNGWPTKEEIENFVTNRWKNNVREMERQGLIVIQDETYEQISWTTTIELTQMIADQFGLTFVVEKVPVVNEGVVAWDP